MKIKVDVQGVDNTQAIEGYCHEKAAKFEEFLGKECDDSCHVEFHLKSHPNHAHQEALVHLKSKNLNLNAKVESHDMYIALDQVTDKVVSLIKKEKERLRDSYRKVETEKSKFNK